MKANSLRVSRFRRPARPSVAGVDLPVRSADLLVQLFAELSAIQARLSIVVAYHHGAQDAAPARRAAARARLAAAVVVDGCAALDWVAELPVLARQVRRAGPEVVAQAERLVSVAERLAG